MCSVRDEEPGVLQSILRCGVPGWPECLLSRCGFKELWRGRGWGYDHKPL